MSDSPAATSLVGSVLADKYLLTDVLGQGGMGTVYLARHVQLPQMAAVKVMRPALVHDVPSRERFKREAAAAARIRHPRVARVYDFGETSEGHVYLAMDFVAGRTLRALLEEEGGLTLPRTIDLVRQIAEGLTAAHDLGLVHRDLKPDNVLVARDERGHDDAKLVDFGIAKAVEGPERQDALTKTGFVVGTPDYMSPEQLLGEPVDRRSDVYALAIVAYQCLTGTLPFASDTPGGGLVARLSEPPRPLAVARPDAAWPDAVEAVLRQGLARDRALRFSSATAFAAALTHAFEGAQALARRDAGAGAGAGGAGGAVRGQLKTPSYGGAAARATPPRATPPRATPPRQAPALDAAPVAAAPAAEAPPTPPAAPRPRATPAPAPPPQIGGPSLARRLWWRGRYALGSWPVLIAVLWFGWQVVQARSLAGGVDRAERQLRRGLASAERVIGRLLP